MVKKKEEVKNTSNTVPKDSHYFPTLKTVYTDVDNVIKNYLTAVDIYYAKGIICLKLNP